MSRWFLRSQALFEDSSKGEIETEWLDDAKTIICERHIGEWSWSSAFWALHRVATWMRQSPHPVDIIYDMTRSTRLPKLMYHAMDQQWLWQRRFWPPMSNRIIIVGGGAEMGHMLKLRQKIAPDTMRYFRWVDTMDEALELLQTWHLEEVSASV